MHCLQVEYEDGDKEYNMTFVKYTVEKDAEGQQQIQVAEYKPGSYETPLPTHEDQDNQAAAAVKPAELAQPAEPAEHAMAAEFEQPAVYAHSAEVAAPGEPSSTAEGFQQAQKSATRIAQVCTQAFEMLMQCVNCHGDQVYSVLGLAFTAEELFTH